VLLPLRADYLLPQISSVIRTMFHVSPVGQQRMFAAFLIRKEFLIRREYKNRPLLPMF